jgi:catechol 2,3-dioxygenase-like lactoylglutathione lyase family enzyme
MLAGSAQADSPLQQPVQPVLSHLGLQQLALTCTDIDRSIAFYRDKLGLPLLFVSNGMAFFDLGVTRLMIAADPARPNLPRPTSVVYFDAPDFERALGRLRASGIPLTGGVEAVQHTNRGDLKLQQFEDPDHNMLAIMGWVPSNGQP